MLRNGQFLVCEPWSEAMRGSIDGSAESREAAIGNGRRRFGFLEKGPDTFFLEIQ